MCGVIRDDGRLNFPQVGSHYREPVFPTWVVSLQPSEEIATQLVIKSWACHCTNMTQTVHATICSTSLACARVVYVCVPACQVVWNV